MVPMFDSMFSRYVAVTVDGMGATRFACIRCNKTFAQKSYVKEHMMIHTGIFNPRKESGCYHLLILFHNHYRPETFSMCCHNVT
jgi:hypothetical protein